VSGSEHAEEPSAGGAPAGGARSASAGSSSAGSASASSSSAGPRLTRRGLLGGLAVGAGGLAVGAAAGYAAAPTASEGPGAAESSPPGAPAALGASTEPCHGAHQAGIATPLQANATFVALDLLEGVDRGALVRLMRLLSDDVTRLTRGAAALADPEPELADVPARLTVTVAFGPGLLAAAGLTQRSPAWLVDGLPEFAIDRLEQRWTGGDLLVQVAAEDPMTISHAVRVLLTDAGPFARVRWMQNGFHRPSSTAPQGMTGRNLMGQVDGTVNPKPGTEDFDAVVWVADGPDWLVGGSSVVVRRIAMDLTVWGGIDERTKEESIGRRLSDGAPLTGGSEFTAPDFDAVDDDGFLVIPPTAHMRLAHAQGPAERILRRPYNYDAGIGRDGVADAGLLFVAYQADPLAQFVPIQARLAEADVLNIWTTPIGSALFAVPPGFQPGEYIGQSLLG
jgi:dye decolorizing peroxidase